MKKNLLIEFILTNRCNKRCKYCDLDFKNISYSYEEIDLFINFIDNNISNIDRLLINFFWWEALLEFDKIKYFVNRTINKKNIFYSLWTNAILLDEIKFNFFRDNNVAIYLSVDTESNKKDYKKSFLKYYDNLTINLILNPNTIYKSFLYFQDLVDYWYKNINIIPVFFTINWDLTSFIFFKKFILFTRKFKSVNCNYISYYDKYTSDLQFILDTNKFFYRDLHTHLWILKQYSILDKKLKNDIEKFSKIWHLDYKTNVESLINNHKQEEILNYSFLLPKRLWFDTNFIIIDKLIKKYKDLW